jgi:hypothetical protein
MLHFVGVVVQVTSRPLVIVSLPLPVPKLLFQPRPCSSMGPLRAQDPRATHQPAPWVLPKVWPPAMRATVSSSFIAMRRRSRGYPAPPQSDPGCRSGLPD